MNWHEVPLLKCTCLKAPKIPLNQFSALLDPIKTALRFGAVVLHAEDFVWWMNINAVIGQLQFAFYSSKPRAGCWDPLRMAGTVKNSHGGPWLLQTVTQLPLSAALDVAGFAALSRCESRRIFRGQELLNFFFLRVYLHKRVRIPASLYYLKELEQLESFIWWELWAGCHWSENNLYFRELLRVELHPFPAFPALPQLLFSERSALCIAGKSSSRGDLVHQPPPKLSTPISSLKYSLGEQTPADCNEDFVCGKLLWLGLEWCFRLLKSLSESWL